MFKNIIKSFKKEDEGEVKLTIKERIEALFTRNTDGRYEIEGNEFVGIYIEDAGRTFITFDFVTRIPEDVEIKLVKREKIPQWTLDRCEQFVDGQIKMTDYRDVKKSYFK